MNEKKYTLIVFDWEGTLCDSTGHVLQKLKQAVIDLRWPMFDEIHGQTLAGLSIEDLISALYPDASLEECTRLQMRYQFHRLVRQKEAALCTGAQSVLNILKERGYLLAVATGKSAAGLASDIEYLQLQDYFSVTRTADQTIVKPHPRMLEEIMDVTQVLPSKTLMVGDGIVDIQLANNAHVDAIGISADPEQREALLAQGAKQVITLLGELINIMI